jgi:hypothetical protein
MEVKQVTELSIILKDDLKDNPMTIFKIKKLLETKYSLFISESKINRDLSLSFEKKYIANKLIANNKPIKHFFTK